MEGMYYSIHKLFFSCCAGMYMIKNKDGNMVFLPPNMRSIRMAIGNSLNQRSNQNDDFFLIVYKTEQYLRQSFNSTLLLFVQFTFFKASL